jgi:hypothetical protein
MQRKNVAALILVAMLTACTTESAETEAESWPVRVVVATDVDMPDGLSFQLEEGTLVMADFAFYGGPLDPDDHYLDELLARAWQWIVPNALAHAGHSHGEAENEGHLDGSFAVPLSEEGVELGSLSLGEGHYFDGRFVLEPAAAETTLGGAAAGAAIPPSLDGQTFYARGILTLNGQQIDVELRSPVASTVAGLDLATYVLADRDNTLMLRFQLGALLASLPLETLVDGEGTLHILDADDAGFAELKVGLKDRLNYVDSEATNP